MIANRILDLIITVLAFFLVPITPITTFVLGFLVSLPLFGLLLLLLLSLVWIILTLPLIGASWLCSKFEFLRNTVGFVGIPWAVVAHTYICLIPSMGEFEDRAYKFMLVETWPFCWEYWRFGNGRLDIWSPEGKVLRTILERISLGNPWMQRTIDKLSRREPLDTDV